MLSVKPTHPSSGPPPTTRLSRNPSPAARVAPVRGRASRLSPPRGFLVWSLDLALLGRGSGHLTPAGHAGTRGRGLAERAAGPVKINRGKSSTRRVGRRAETVKLYYMCAAAAHAVSHLCDLTDVTSDVCAAQINIQQDHGANNSHNSRLSSDVRDGLRTRGVGRWGPLGRVARRNSGTRPRLPARNSPRDTASCTASATRAAALVSWRD